MENSTTLEASSETWARMRDFKSVLTSVSMSRSMYLTTLMSDSSVPVATRATGGRDERE